MYKCEFWEFRMRLIRNNGSNPSTINGSLPVQFQVLGCHLRRSQRSLQVFLGTSSLWWQYNILCKYNLIRTYWSYLHINHIYIYIYANDTYIYIYIFEKKFHFCHSSNNRCLEKRSSLHVKKASHPKWSVVLSHRPGWPFQLSSATLETSGRRGQNIVIKKQSQERWWRRHFSIYS